MTLVLAFVPILFIDSPLYAQSLLLKDYSTADGLPDSRVAPLLEDRDGYIWFGTQAGLTRYDGKEFVNFGPAHEIPGIFGRSILQDHAGAIWFAYTGFQEGGVTRYWKERTDTIPLPPGTQPHEIVEDPGGNIWVAADNGLHELQFTDSLRTRWKIRTLTSAPVSAAYVSQSGELYVATAEGLFRFGRNGFTTVFRTPPGKAALWHVRPYSFYETEQGDLWFGGYRGAYCLHQGRLRAFGAPEGVPDRGVWCFCEDEHGVFFAGTMNGLYRVRATGEGYTFEKVPSFGDAVVYDMLRDREGNLWFASAPGLRRLLRVGTVVPFNGEGLLATSGIGPIQESGDGTIYFGSRNLGLFFYRNGSIQPPIVPLPSQSLTVSALAPGRNNDCWTGLWRGGVVLMHGRSRGIFTSASGLPSDGVHCLLNRPDGSVLVGTAAGVGIIDRYGQARRLGQSLLGGRIVFDIKGGGGDTLWFGTDDGVRRGVISGDTIRGLPLPVSMNDLAGRFVYVVLIGTHHRMYFGTDGAGVAILDRGIFSKLTTDDGLVSNRIFALAEDSLGNLWVGTAEGLSCVNGRCVRNLTYAQGFGEIGMHGLLTDRHGALWVSAVPGVKRLSPARIIPSTLPPQLYLTEIVVDGVQLNLQQRVELRPDPAIITFRYAALSFTDEKNVRYRYSLDGFDKDWSGPVTGREVRYTHLPPGQYQFRLLARSGDGVWSTTPVTYAFTILPPLWARWWFIAASGLLLAAALYGGYRYRLNRILQLQQTRDRIAMDLHDDVGSSLTRISVVTEVARRKAEEGTAVTTDSLVHIGEIARSIIDSLGDIVWTVEAKHDNLQNVIRRIVQFGEEVCEGRGISFETDLKGSFESVRLAPEQRRDIYLVFKEGINNIVKHSGATLARFRVQSTKGLTVMELFDNGSGIRENAEEAGHGLGSLRERGERAGVRFFMESKDGEGTRICLEVKTG